MKTFNYFWKDGRHESVEAATAVEGFDTLGYEREQASGLAFWEVGESEGWTFQEGRWVKT